MPFRLRFHHIGVACQDISKVKAWIKQTHPIIHEGESVFDPLQNATLVLLRLEDSLTIELISGDPVKDILKRGMSFYHVCYTVANMEKAVEDFREKGAIIFSAPKKAILFDNKKVAFLGTPMGIIELLEE